MDLNREQAVDGPGRPDGWALAIDFGTSFSSAALAAEEGIDLVDIHGDRRVPSMVLLAEDGRLLVGMLAANQAASAPDRLERTPKALVGRSPVLLLGGRPVTVVDAVGALVTAFVDEARRRRGGTEPAAVTLTHPVRWGAERRRVLEQAAVSAGLDPGLARLVEEPVAAASAFRSERVRPGSLVAVYDLGGGTFDAAVLEATETGFVVVGPPGGDDQLGGEEFDQRLLAHVGEQIAAVDPDGWESLSYSEERRWRRAHAQLRDLVRLAKETLSVAQQASVYVPGVDREVLVTRAEFERLIAADVDRTLAILEDVVEAAGTTPDELTAVYPVGGSSRIPLVAHELLARYGDRVITWDDPQAAVALGAARLARHHLRLLDERPPASGPPPRRAPEPESEPEPPPAPPLPSASSPEPEPEPEDREPPPLAPEPETEDREPPELAPEPKSEDREPQPPAPEPETEDRESPLPPADPTSPKPRPSPRRRRRVFGALGAAGILGAGVLAAVATGLIGSSDERTPRLGIACPRPDGNDFVATLDRACLTRFFEAYRDNVTREGPTDYPAGDFGSHMDNAFSMDTWMAECFPDGEVSAADTADSSLKVFYVECVGMALLYSASDGVLDVQLTDRDEPRIPADWAPGVGNAFTTRDASNQNTVPIRVGSHSASLEPTVVDPGYSIPGNS